MKTRRPICFHHGIPLTGTLLGASRHRAGNIANHGRDDKINFLAQMESLRNISMERILSTAELLGGPLRRFRRAFGVRKN